MIESALACDMTAIPPAERPAHVQLARRLFAGAVFSPVDDQGGEGVRTMLDAAAFDDVARWIANERVCCPFLRFRIELEPEGGTIHLTLTGPTGTRAFLESELR